MLSEEQLQQIEAWGEQIITEDQRGVVFAAKLCEYTDALPTHSIRSQMLSLVQELREARALAVGKQVGWYRPSETLHGSFTRRDGSISDTYTIVEQFVPFNAPQDHEDFESTDWTPVFEAVDR